jgi:RNA polymerase sigma factor (sigma-70 family)
MDQNRADELTEILRRAADGDHEAWDWLVQQYSSLLWSVVRTFRLGEQQAADVVQTTWLRLVENLSSIRDPRALPAWLSRTARNASVNALREAKCLKPLAEDYEYPSANELPDAAFLRHERAALVRAALSRLCERDRLLLTALAATPPLPYKEISFRLGMPVGSIGPTRMRALRRLRAELATSGLVDATTL